MTTTAATVAGPDTHRGTAMGIAVVGAVFFNRLAASDGNWSSALRTALSVTIGLVLVALAAALADVIAARRGGRFASAGKLVDGRRGTMPGGGGE